MNDSGPTRGSKSLKEVTVSSMEEIAGRGAGSSGLFGSRNERDKTGPRKIGETTLDSTPRSGAIMPYVNIQIAKGVTRSLKAQLMREVTDSPVRILRKKPEHTHVVIQEIADEEWGFSGLLTDDWKKKQAR